MGYVWCILLPWKLMKSKTKPLYLEYSLLTQIYLYQQGKEIIFTLTPWHQRAQIRKSWEMTSSETPTLPGKEVDLTLALLFKCGWWEETDRLCFSWHLTHRTSAHTILRTYPVPVVGLPFRAESCQIVWYVWNWVHISNDISMIYHHHHHIRMVVTSCSGSERRDRRM